MRLRTAGRRGLAVATMAAASLAVLALIVGGLLRLHVETGVKEFVPRGDAALRTTNEIGSAFGGDPVVVLFETAKPMTLFSKDNLPNLLHLEGELSKLPDMQVVYGPATVLNQIATQEQQLLAEFSGYRDALRARAEQRAKAQGLRGAAITDAQNRASAAFDQQFMALLQQGMSAGLPTMYNQQFVDHVLVASDGKPRARWQFLVPRTTAVAILVRPKPGLTQTHSERLVSAVSRTVAKAKLPASRTTISGVPTVVAGLGHEIRNEALLLAGAAGLAVSAWFFFMPWTRRRHRLLPVLATGCGTAVTLALAGWTGRPLALTAVAFLPVLLGIGSDFTAYLHKAVPRRIVVASAAASVAGFGSLALTRIPAVADLGVSLAVGLVISVLVSLALVTRFPQAPEMSPRERPARRLSTMRGVAAAAVVVAIGGWIASPHLSMQADFKSLASGLSAYSDAQHVADVLGADGEVTVQVRGRNVLTPEVLDWMDGVRGSLAGVGGLRPVLSAPEMLGFLGTAPTAEQITSAMRLLPAYITKAAVSPDHTDALLIYGVRLESADRLANLQTRIQAAIKNPPAGVTASVGGLPMVAVSARSAFADRTWLTAGIGIIAAAAAAGLILRRRVALLAALSAAIAYGVAGAAAFVLGIPLTPLTAGLGSLTAAVACEFTIVLAYAREHGRSSVSRAVSLAAAASATGYAVLLLSNLGPVRGFGALLAATVLVSLAASRIVVAAFVEAPAPMSPKPAPSPSPELVEVPA
ncbi:MAG: RND transporter [Marmoricola sp.]